MRDAGDHPRLTGIAGYDVVHIALGLLLLTAAALKGHQLATEPVAGTGLLTSRWFLIGVVEFELFFGLWLLSGLYPRRTWQAALLCFAGFACVSLYKAVSGEASCGCFGKVPVNPWYTLVLDLGAVAALLCWRPARGQSSVPGSTAFSRRRAAGIAAVSVIVGIPAALAMGSYRAGTIGETGDIFGDSEFVVLEPETWIGKRFPLLKYIDIGDRLGEGEWIVLLYRHDCRSCQEAILEYEWLAHARQARAGSGRVALVEMPPYGGSAEGPVAGDSPCLRGRVSDVREWLVESPLEVSLAGGIAVKVGGKRRSRTILHGGSGFDLARESVL